MLSLMKNKKFFFIMGDYRNLPFKNNVVVSQFLYLILSNDGLHIRY